MKKLIKLAALSLMALTSQSMTNDPQTIFLTGLEFVTSGGTVCVRARYSCINNSDDRCIFAYKTKIGDGPYNATSSWNLNKFTICENQICGGCSTPIAISNLQAYNYFGVTMCPIGSMPGLTEKTIQFRPFGNKQVRFYESYNNRGFTSGYFKENWNSVDPALNYNEEDRITFTNFENEFVDQVYNFIDLSYLKFTYTDGINKNNIKAKCRFDFYDAHNNFPNFSLLEDSMYRYINLDIISDDEGYLRFVSADDLYYDPSSHESSSKFISGYQKTDKLYLPKSKYSDLKKMHCRISMDVEGYTKYNAYGEFDINFSRKLFGDCTDSEYCTHISEDDSYNVMEKKVVVDL